MTSGINTYRPGVPAFGGWTEQLNGWTVVGAANAVAALQDASDASYIQAPPYNLLPNQNILFCSIPIAAPTIPANESVNYVQVRMRIADLGTLSAPLFAAAPLNVRLCSTALNLNSGGYILVGNTQDVWNAPIQTITNVTGAASPKTPGGHYWFSATYTARAGVSTNQYYNSLDVVQLGSIWYATRQWRIYEMWVDYSYNDDPGTPTANAAVNLSKPRPSVTWTVTDTENDAMLLHDTVYYTEAQRLTAGWYPLNPSFPVQSRTIVLVNGLNGGPLSTYTVTPSNDLPNNTTYRSYSRVTQIPQQRTSPWGTSGPIAVLFETPVQPSITAVAESNNGRVRLNVQGADNLLTFNESCFEAANPLSDWSSSNCTLATATQSFQGTVCLQLTASAAGSYTYAMLQQANWKPVVAGQTYTAMAWFKRTSASGNRNCRMEIVFYDSGNNPTGSVLSTTTPAVPNTFTQVTATGVAPANSVYANIVCDVLNVVAAGEVYVVDQVSFAPGTNTTDWSPGSMTATQNYNTVVAGPNAGTGQTILIERTADGGTTWSTVRPIPYDTTLAAAPSSALAVGTQLSGNIYDYEAPMGIAVRYRATTITTLAIGDAANPSSAQPSQLSSIPSALTAAVTLTAPVGGQGFWLKNVQAGLVMAVDVLDDTFELDFPIQEAMYNPLGRPDPVVVTDVANTVQSGQTTFEFLTDANWTTFRDSFFKSLQTCLLQKYDGQQWYIQFIGTGNLNESKGPVPLYRTFKTKWVEVARP